MDGWKMLFDMLERPVVVLVGVVPSGAYVCMDISLWYGSVSFCCCLNSWFGWFGGWRGWLTSMCALGLNE